MTNMQINFQRYLEDQRHNYVMEGLQSRNLALQRDSLGESIRHNKAQESLTAAKQAEDQRHNYVSENLGAMNVELGWGNVAVGWGNVAVGEKNAAAKMIDSRVHQSALALQQSQWETQKTWKAVELAQQQAYVDQGWVKTGTGAVSTFGNLITSVLSLLK